MNLYKGKPKYVLIALWLGLVTTCLYFYLFKGVLLQEKFLALFGSSALAGYAVFLILACLRGFTLIPVTYFIIIGLILLPQLPLYLIIIASVLVSSACVYYFSERLRFDAYFEGEYPAQIRRIKRLLAKNEIFIVALWSFMPFLPTDVICYVCGSLKVSVKKFLLGILIGEGVACAIYIFLGKALLAHLKF